jgi:hypothetical protein
MGTLASLVPVLGLFSGALVAKLTLYEFKQGEKYFKFLMYAMLAVVIGAAVWQRARGPRIELAVPFFLLFIPVGTLYHNKYAVLIGTAASYIIGALISASA